MRSRIKGEKVCSSNNYTPTLKEITKAKSFKKYYIRVFGRLMQISALEAKSLRDSVKIIEL